MAKFVQSSAHSCWDPEEAKLFLVAGSNRIPASLSHGSISNWSSSQHKVWGVCQDQAFSAFKIAKETLFIDLALCNNENCGDIGDWLTPACVLSVWYSWWIWAGLLHKCSVNRKDWQDIELGSRNVCSSSMAKVVWCSAHSCCDPEQATWFLVAGSNRIPGSLSHSSISN